jgi:hypothetical protein
VVKLDMEDNETAPPRMRLEPVFGNAASMLIRMKEPRLALATQMAQAAQRQEETNSMLAASITASIAASIAAMGASHHFFVTCALHRTDVVRAASLCIVALCMPS